MAVGAQAGRDAPAGLAGGADDEEFGGHASSEPPLAWIANALKAQKHASTSKMERWMR
jgi:hypothetical protein